MRTKASEIIMAVSLSLSFSLTLFLSHSLSRLLSLGVCLFKVLHLLLLSQTLILPTSAGVGEKSFFICFSFKSGITLMSLALSLLHLFFADCTVQVSLNSLMKQQQSQQMNELMVTVFTRKVYEVYGKKVKREDEKKAHDSEGDKSNINFRSTARTKQE